MSVLDPLSFQVGTNKDGSQSNHYTKMKIQVAEFCLVNMSDEELKGVLKWMSLKYTWRDKDDFLEDLEKAEHYISMIKYELKSRSQGIKTSKV